MRFHNIFLKLKKIRNPFLVFVFFLVLCFIPHIVKGQGASFYLLPSEGNCNVGENFSVNVFLSSEGVAMNAAESTINFSTDNLKVLSVSKQNSIFTFWIQEPIFSNSQGTISFGGGLPNPGFIGKAGKVITITFQGKSAGEARVNFTKEKILANDPWGTDIFRSSKGGIYSITIPKITPIFPEGIPETDKEPPQSFEIIVDNEGDPTNPTPFLYFETKDDLSGMSHYEVKIGEQIFEVEVGKTMPWRTPVLTPSGTYNITVKAFDRAGNFTGSRAEAKIESIPIPKITTCPKIFNPERELLYLGGIAIPNSKITVNFEKGEELIKKWEIVSDGEGDWSLSKEILVKSGTYKVLVRAEDKRGVISDSSEPCLVKVTLGAIRIGPLVILYRYLTWFAIILFILLLIALLYFILRIRKTKKTIERESEDLKEKFYKEYKELEDDIARELEILKQARGRRGITEQERKREEQLLKNLRDVKEVLERELKDIEKLK